MSLVPYLYGSPFHTMERDFLNDPFFDHSVGKMVPHDFFRPDLTPWDMLRPFEQILKPMEELSTVMNQLALNDRSVTSDDEKFQIRVDVQHFRPEEVSVKVIDKHVIVKGKHEEKQDEHGYVSRQFVRRYALPQGCLPDTVESKLSSDGVLTVTAPKVLALPSVGERIVPIAHTGPVHKRIGA